MILLFVAAVLGDNVNYFIGKNIGLKMFQLKIGGRVLVKQEYLNKTHSFYELHGPKTIIMARFVPIVRTFAPFVAGIAEMKYSKFLPFDILGGILWVGIATMAGYFFGGIPIVKENFELVIIGIIFISIVPILIEVIRNKMSKSSSKA